MTEFNMTIQSGKTKVIHTAGKYCDKDIFITAQGGGDYDNGYDKGYNDGIEAGKQAEHDAFWDAYQQNGNKSNYQGAFSGDGWNDTTFRPKYHLKPKNANLMFNACGIGDVQAALDKVGITLDFSGVTGSYNNQMLTDSKITRIGVVDLSACTLLNYTFFYAQFLETVEKVILADTPPKLNTPFLGLPKLTNITFEGVIGYSVSFADSPLLTTASVQSIIDHLQDLTGATAQTITFHATVGGNMTEAQKTAISQKNWTLVY